MDATDVDGLDRQTLAQLLEALTDRLESLHVLEDIQVAARAAADVVLELDRPRPLDYRLRHIASGYLLAASHCQAAYAALSDVAARTDDTVQLLLRPVE